MACRSQIIQLIIFTEFCTEPDHNLHSLTYNRISPYRNLHNMDTLSLCVWTVLRRQSHRVVSTSNSQSCGLLAGFVLRCSEFNTSAMLVNSQLVTSSRCFFLILLCFSLFYLDYLLIIELLKWSA